MLKKAFFKKYTLSSLLFLFSLVVVGQEKYWLEFNISDLEQSSSQTEKFKDSLKNKYNEQIEFLYQSKWHPTISVLVHEKLLGALNKHDFVKSIKHQRALEPLQIKNLSPTEYSYALEQLKAHFITDTLKLSGQGVKIGVIDGGFMDADAEPSLNHLIERDQIKFFKDYLLQGNKDPFYGRRISQDDHGTQVLRMIAGSDSGNGIKYGMAENALLYLARTDHGIRENRIEEDYWVASVELFHEMGIRLVNSSLGYTDGFDKRKENHSKKEVNGKSAMITKTAQMAAEKGMLIVSAAGNDGNNKWRILSLPSDAQDILTVGAVRFDDWSKIYYSSIGPEKLEYVKPDVACFAANGTSFAAPVITGLAACIWEYDSTLSNFEIINIIKSSAHLAKTPNNYIGYGIPDSEKILKILKEGNIKTNLKSVTSEKPYIEIDIPAGIEDVIIFHKKDSRNLLKQESIEIVDGLTKIRVDKLKESRFSTVVAQDKLYWEIEWQ